MTASVETLYPFSDEVTITVTAQKPFTYYVRIPGWIEHGSILVDGASTTPLSPMDGLQAIPVKAGTTLIALNLPVEIKTGAIIPYTRSTPLIHSNRIASTWLDRRSPWATSLRL